MKKGLVAMVAAASLAACGGGGGGGSAPAPAPAPANPTAVFTSQNYLDALWLAVVGFDRINTAATVLDSAFEAALLANDVPGTYPCSGGGSVTYSRSGADRSFTANQCREVYPFSTVIYRSGAVSTSNAQTAQAGNLVYISAGTFQLTSAVINMTSADPTIDRAGDEVFSGNVTVTGTPTQVTGTGTLSVSRAGRVDSYTNISVSGQQADDINFATASFALNSPRFTAPYTVSYSDATVSATLTAQDGSRLVVALIAGTDRIRSTIFNSAGSQTFTSDVAVTSSESLAARTRVLQ